MRLSPSTRQRLLQLTAQHGNFVNFERELGAPDRLALEHFGARLIRVIPPCNPGRVADDAGFWRTRSGTAAPVSIAHALGVSVVSDMSSVFPRLMRTIASAGQSEMLALQDVSIAADGEGLGRIRAGFACLTVGVRGVPWPSGVDRW